MGLFSFLKYDTRKAVREANRSECTHSTSK